MKLRIITIAISLAWMMLPIAPAAAQMMIPQGDLGWGPGGDPYGMGQPLLDEGWDDAPFWTCSGDGEQLRPARIWGRAEYLYWWTRRHHVPVLISSSPAGTAQGDAGVLDQPDTTVLFGGLRPESKGQSGVGFEAGYWLTADQAIGIGGRYRIVDEDSIEQSFSSAGSPILARPFFDTDLPGESSLLVAYPGISQGTVTAGDVLSIDIGEVFLRHYLYSSHGNRLDFIGGYQYALVDSEVFAMHQLESLDPAGRVPVGTLIDSRDSFRARNEYHGGFVGLMSESQDGPITWRLLSKVAFGNVNEEVTISGTTTTTVPGGGAATSNQGLLALSTNRGVYEQDQFSIMPELQVTMAYQVTCNLAVTLGYSLVYWTDLATAGPLVDTTINSSQIDGNLVGASRPGFTWDSGHIWAQGIQSGIEWRF